MDQTRVHNEIDIASTKAIMTTVMSKVIHERLCSHEYAWKKVRQPNATVLVPAGLKMSDDIRCHG